MAMFEKFSRHILLLSLIVFSLIATAVPALADVTWPTSFSDTGAGSAQNGSLSDKNFWLNISATNTGSQAWGYFHMDILQIPGENSIDNVRFSIINPYAPKSSQSLYGWYNYNNFKSLDFMYFNDPVLTNNTGTFSAYITNPDNVSFSVSYYPTVVPEPISSILFVTGGTLLAGQRYLKRRKTA
jgi:hypothetical protein